MQYYTMKMREGKNGVDDPNIVADFIKATNSIGVGEQKSTKGYGTFCDMHPGDIVLLRAGGDPLVLVRVISEPTPYNAEGKFPLFDNWLDIIRKVEVLSWYNEDHEKYSIPRFSGSSFISTCAKVNKDEQKKIISQWLEIVMENSAKGKGEAFLQKVKDSLLKTKNIILTGAPGTGKTYLAREIAYALTGDTAENHPHVGFCQFHPSYDYTDFVEGIRPCENETTGVQFSRRNGIFKDFCISALKGTTQNSQDNFEDVWNKLVSILEEKRYLDIPLLTGNASFLIEMNEYGTGLANRTYANDDAKQRGEWINGQSKFFSKDQLYNIYRGLPGIPSGGHDNYRKAIVKFLKANYGLKDYKPGSETPQDTQQPFVFIIDEINRGDISKIFGELFFALDPGYRGKKGAIKTQYANLAPADDPFKDGFYIPKNVFVIGTMNDIDRGVESMDFAIRRRFTWIQVKPEDRLSMWEGNLASDIRDEAEKRMLSLNAAIAEEEVLGPAYQIGPAYFLKLADYKSSTFENLWSWHIEPLIEEYLRGIPDAKQIKQKLYKKYQLTDEVPSEN